MRILTKEALNRVVDGGQNARCIISKCKLKRERHTHILNVAGGLIFGLQSFRERHLQISQRRRIGFIFGIAILLVVN